MSMAWMVGTQKRDINETESDLLTTNLHQWSPHKTMNCEIKPPDLFSQRGIVFNYMNLIIINTFLGGWYFMLDNDLVHDHKSH